MGNVKRVMRANDVQWNGIERRKHKRRKILKMTDRISTALRRDVEKSMARLFGINLRVKYRPWYL